MVTNIFINNKDLGFLTQQAITVQRFDENGDLIWCNHAGAEEEQDEDFYGLIRRTLVCNKCDAYRPLDSQYHWENAPIDGVHE